MVRPLFHLDSSRPKVSQASLDAASAWPISPGRSFKTDVRIGSEPSTGIPTMSSCTRPARINVKALLILIIVVGVAGVGAVGVHFVQKRRMADRALAQGQAALAEHNASLAETRRFRTGV